MKHEHELPPISLSKQANLKLWACTLLGGILIVLGATLLKDYAPQPLKGIDLHVGRMVANIGVVLIFIKVTDIFFYQPLSKAIRQRNHEIETTYAEAEKLRTQMKEMKNNYEKTLEFTQAEAREEIQNQLKAAQLIKQQITQEAEEKAQNIIQQAEHEIESYRSQTVNNLKKYTIDLTLQATEKVIHKKLDTQMNRVLIKEFIEELEVKQS